MKLLLVALLAFTIGLLCHAQVPLPSTIRTLDGKEFKGVTLRSVTPDALQIMHDDGTASINFANLPEELRKQFGYNPAKAADFAARTAAARAATTNAESKAASSAASAQEKTAQATRLSFVVDAVDADGTMVRPLTSQAIGGGLQGATASRLVPGRKSVFVKGLKNVIEDQRYTILAYRDGIYTGGGRSLEQWVFVQMVPEK